MSIPIVSGSGEVKNRSTEWGGLTVSGSKCSIAKGYETQQQQERRTS